MCFFLSWAYTYVVDYNQLGSTKLNVTSSATFSHYLSALDFSSLNALSMYTPIEF